jgi:uncharacterized protein YidB (DUF937 family)
MGFGLDDLIGMVSGGKGGGIMDAVQGLLGQAGGVQGLVQRFQGAGLGGKADSWVRDGDNEAVSADEVRRALGQDEIARAAQRAGVSEDEAASGLAGLLPDLVDKLTPGGRMPDAGDIGGMLSGLLTR